MDHLRSVRTVTLPPEGGRPVTKSIEMSDQGRWGMEWGCNNAETGCPETLYSQQMGQAVKYFPISFSMPGHQKCCLMLKQVLLIPGWQEKMEAWAKWIICDLWEGGTNHLFGRQPSGTATWSPSCQTWSSLPHVTAPMTQEEGRILWGVIIEGPESICQESASDFMFLEPGR